MEGECFLVKNATLSERKEHFYDDAYDINLDSALKELGMLSTITDSRIDYLKEQDLDCLKDKMKRKCCNSLPSAPLCVVHMNSDFVTQFSVSKNSAQVTEFEVSDELKPKVLMKQKINKRKRKLFAPYFINRQIIPPEKFEEEFNECKADILAEEQASPPPPPPIISRQDSGNKSNPSSPVKSQNSLTSVGCSIFRSRSLDDLEVSKLYNYNESCDLASHGEIDTVSQRISKLHVS